MNLESPTRAKDVCHKKNVAQWKAHMNKQKNNFFMTQSENEGKNVELRLIKPESNEKKKSKEIIH